MQPYQIPGDTTHQFVKGTKFNDILYIYLFDRELRLLIMDAIERIEIALRTKIIYVFSIKHGAHWFEDVAHFKNEIYHKKFLKNLDKDVGRSYETFIRHYKTKYKEPKRPPSWMSLEILTFTTLSLFYENLRTTNEKKKISEHFMLRTNYNILQSWLNNIGYVRNICAHHGRLWNRALVISPILLSNPAGKWIKSNSINSNKIYATLCCINYLLETINPRIHLGDRILKLLYKYKRINIKQMGFPSNWARDKFWNIKIYSRIQYLLRLL